MSETVHVRTTPKINRAVFPLFSLPLSTIIHTRIRTRIWTLVSVHASMSAYTYTYTNKHAQRKLHTQTYTHKLTHASLNTHSCTHILTHILTRTHPCIMHTHPFTHVRADLLHRRRFARSRGQTSSGSGRFCADGRPDSIRSQTLSIRYPVRQLDPSLRSLSVRLFFCRVTS